MSADTDGSTQSLSVSDNVSGSHPPYFALSAGQVVLTSVGAAYFNSHEAEILRSVQVTVTAKDDATEGGNETEGSGSTTLAAGNVAIAHEAPPTVTLQPVAQSGLVEGGFAAGLALFTYLVSADTDGSSVTVVVNDDISGTHDPLYALQGNEVVLTAAGAAYFNSHEAADLQSLQISVSAVDDVNGVHAETYTTTTVSLADLTIAPEAAPVVTLHTVGNLQLVEGGFTTGQALFNYTVSADSDGSTQTPSVSDSVAGQHAAYFTIHGSQVVLTAAGASYFNSHEAADLQSITVSLAATDDAGSSYESRGSASATLQSVVIAPEAAPEVTVSAIQQSGLVEEGFTLNQALFSYTVSGDSDGSALSLTVADNIAGLHPAYFELQQGQVVLTAAGVAYFNTLEAEAIQSVQVTVTASDDASPSAESTGSASASLASIAVAHEAAPSVTLESASHNGFIAGSFAAGQAILNYAVGNDTDGSTVLVTVTGINAGLFHVDTQNQQILLTAAGANRFNSNGIPAIEALSFSITARDDAGEPSESSTTVTKTLVEAGVVVNIDAPPSLSMSAIAQNGLSEGHFTAGQALFTYALGHDADNSVITMSVDDNIVALHTPYFALQGNNVVLTAAGANYFNAQEASTLQAIEVSVIATDDAGTHPEDQTSATADLSHIAIAAEAAPTVTVAPIAHPSFQEGAFTTGMALFDYSVSADADGSTVGVAVSDNVLGSHPAYFALQSGQVVLTAAGASYFNSQEASALQGIQVTVTATDDAGAPDESQGSAHSTLNGVTISPEAAPSVTLAAIPSSGLMEGAFSAGQALFSYSVSADPDGSTISLRVIGDDQSTYHVASQEAPITVHDMFSIDTQHHALVLTNLGAEYFNSVEAPTLQALTVDLVATDDAGNPSPFESESVGRADLSHVSIAYESPPTLSLQPIAQTLHEGAFTAGEAIFSFSAGADPDGSHLSYSIFGTGDQTYWGPNETVINVWDMFNVDAQHGTLVLTDVGAQYLNSQEASGIQTLQLGLTVTDEESDSYAAHGSATASLADATISSDAEQIAFVGQPIDGNVLTAGQFVAGEALFHYTASDADGSYISVAPVGDNAAYFYIDGESQNVVLTQAGADYFNTHEVADIRAMPVTFQLSDDFDGEFSELSPGVGVVLGDVVGAISQPAPTVSVAAIPYSGLIEGGFSAGQALYSYTVSADTDGSVMSLSVSDNAPAGGAGPHAAYFTLESGQVVLTSAGADYFNTHDGTSLEALRVTVSATDDAGQPDESHASATTSLGADGVGIGAEAPVTVTLQAIDQQGLQEGAFSAGQALFSYSLSADSDGSVISLRVVGDDQHTYSVASQQTPITLHDMFGIDTQHQVLTLTTLGAEYFNSVEGSTIQGLVVDLVATDDAGIPAPFESESVGRADLSHVPIAYEDPEAITVQPIASSLYEGTFTTGEAIFSITGDSDGSALRVDISGVDGQSFYYWQTDGNITAADMFSFDAQHNTLVLTDIGAQFMNSNEADVIQSLRVSVTVTDEENDSYASQVSATVSLADTPIYSNGEQLQITAQPIDGNALVEGYFAAGQAVFQYSVSDPDGSHLDVSPTGDSAAYFSIDTESQNVVLTQAGANYFNTHELADIQALVVGLIVTDDPYGDSAETGTEAHWMLRDVLGTISANENPQARISAVDGVLKEDAFRAGQAIFAYSTSDSDGSALEFGITGTNAEYFSVDAQHSTVVLTDAGAAYFNSHEAADIRSLQLQLVTREDDASSLRTLTLGEVISIAPEDAPTVTTQYVTPTPGRYLAGQTLYTFSVSETDPDGGRIDVSVTDNVIGGHAPYFAVSGGNIVLTEAGAAYMTNTSPALLSYVTVGLTVTDDGGEVSTRMSLPALGPDGGNQGPVALDLNGDGVQYVGLNAGVQYDYAGTGASVDTAWVAPQDGVLGYKVAGGATQVVFSTIAGQTDLQGLEQVYDTNHDGVLNSNDPTFANFGVVQIAGAGATPTFTTLASLGVTSISLTSNGQTTTAANGDVVVYGQTTYTLADGTKLAAADVSFATTPIDSSQTTGAATSATAVSSASTHTATSVTLVAETVTNVAATAHTDSSTLTATGVAATAHTDTSTLTATGVAATAHTDTSTLTGTSVAVTAHTDSSTLVVTNAAAAAHTDSSTIAGASASAAAIETASLAAAGAAVTPVPVVSADPHAAVALAPNLADPLATDSHALAAASSAMTIDLTGATYTVTPNLPATAVSVALDTFSLAADSGAHTSTVSGSGSSWVDILSTSAAQSVSMISAQPDAHATTAAADGTTHPEGWVAAVDTATTDPQTAATPAATGDTNPLVNLPAIAPADLLLHDSTTVATNPWHA